MVSHPMNITKQVLEKALKNSCIEQYISSSSFRRLSKNVALINKISLFSQKLVQHTLQGLQNLTSDDELLPESGLKGVFFCQGDDGLSISIGGSLYAHEEDWAANATFYSNIDDMGCEFIDLEEILNGTMNTEEAYFLLRMISIFSIHKALNEAPRMKETLNTTMVVGECSGDEIILGYTLNGIFHKKIRIIKDGNYNKPSTCPQKPETPSKPTGPLWSYMQHNYLSLIREKGLAEYFIEEGEAAAREIARRYKLDFCINRCPLCEHIKKTPRARLCLNCGNWSEPKCNCLLRQFWHFILRLIQKVVGPCK